MFGLNKRGKRAPSTKTVLLDTIRMLPNPQRSHASELWILTCYINFDRVAELIKIVKQERNIDYVFLMFNASEAYRFGVNSTLSKLDRIVRSYEKDSVAVEWRAISTGDTGLMHAKAYGFLQRAKKTNSVTSGFVLISSGNFTSSGFHTASNIELGYFSKQIDDLRRFESIYDYLWENRAVDIKPKLDDCEDILFYFSLLSYGVFLYKWTADINSMTGVKYGFTDDAMEELKGVPTNPLLVDLNARAERASFTVSYLNFADLPRKAFPREFSGMYTVETFIGRWCPTPVWREVKNCISKDLDVFIKKFRSATTPKKLEQAKRRIQQDSSDLYDQDLIRGPVNIERWETRIKNLRRDEDRLRRLHIGYEVFSMPYDYSDSANIEKLYESFENTLASIQKPINESLYLIKKRSLDAIESWSLSQFDLTLEEKRRLRNKFRENSGKTGTDHV